MTNYQNCLTFPCGQNELREVVDIRMGFLSATFAKSKWMLVPVLTVFGESMVLFAKPLVALSISAPEPHQHLNTTHPRLHDFNEIQFGTSPHYEPHF